MKNTKLDRPNQDCYLFKDAKISRITCNVSDISELYDRCGNKIGELYGCLYDDHFNEIKNEFESDEIPFVHIEDCFDCPEEEMNLYFKHLDDFILSGHIYDDLYVKMISKNK